MTSSDIGAEHGSTGGADTGLSPQRREGVGDRVRTARELAGLARWELARDAGFSESLLKQVENGDKTASPWFVAKSARALRMSTRELYGEYVPSYGTERAGVADLETAVMAGPAVVTEDRPLTTVADLEHRVATALEDSDRARFDRVAAGLPELLADGYRLAAAPGQDRERVYGRLAHAYLRASLALYFLGSDVAIQAAEQGARVAELAEDPVLAAVLRVEGSLTLMQRGAWPAVEWITEQARAAAEAAPDTVAARSVRGFSHLRAAIASARSGGGLDRSNEHLDHARELAALVPVDASYAGTNFNIDNTTMHGVGAMVEASEGGLALGRQAPVGQSSPPPTRLGAYRMDLSRAHLLVGDYDRSLQELQRARDVAPQLTRYHPQFPETVRVLARQLARRRGTVPELAKWGGVRV